MNKRIAIPIISVLAVGSMVLGAFYFQETNKLNDAQDEIAGLEGNVSALETELAELEAEVSELALATFFPDANLRAAIREALNKPQGLIYTYELEALIRLEAPQRGISDVSGLEYLINLWVLNLGGNNISDILPLVENSGVSAGDFVNLSGNPLSATSVDVYIPQLEARGVDVIY